MLDIRSNEVLLRALTDDPYRYSLALGCASCPNIELCGGLSVRDAILDCMDLCCGSPNECTNVCAKNPARYVDQKREVLGFDLANVSRVVGHYKHLPHDVVPLIYHGTGRNRAATGQIFALRLRDVVRFSDATVRYPTREGLCAAFKIDHSALIILSGVDHDEDIEPWWTLGRQRTSLIRKLRDLQIQVVTTPNFSLVLDKPRTDDLHAIKRIAIVWSEFEENGIACALHVNSRTLRDFDRWAEFVRERPEIQVISYEFITGGGRKDRREFHIQGLRAIAQAADRPIDIVVRGDPDVVAQLRPYFSNVIYIDTTAYMKTIKRQRAVRVNNNALDWVSTTTTHPSQVDTMLEHNISESALFLRGRFYGQRPQQPIGDP
ncbi:DUF4417 domain-containing protein [Rhizobium sp.]|uniref:DUF4417 domain-containing protein n=1 Tax=Rhizobium sp. TaxID=391 RepID=UPI0028A72674